MRAQSLKLSDTKVYEPEQRARLSRWGGDQKVRRAFLSLADQPGTILYWDRDATGMGLYRGKKRLVNYSGLVDYEVD